MDIGVERRSDGIHRIYWTRTDSNGKVNFVYNILQFKNLCQQFCNILAYLSYTLGEKIPIDVVLMAIIKIFIQMMNVIGSHGEHPRSVIQLE